MKQTGAALLALAVLWPGHGVAAPAQDPRWVAFKTTQGPDGEIEHQIDRRSIKQEGPYRTFWTRMIVVQFHSPLSFNNGADGLVFRSQKFAVDCPAGKMGTHFVDTNLREEFKARANLKTMTWSDLGRHPAVRQTVCAPAAKAR